MYPHRPGSQDQNHPAYHYPPPAPPNSSQPPPGHQPNGVAYPQGSGPPQQQTTLPPISEYSQANMALHPPQPPPPAGYQPQPPPNYPPPPNHYPPYRAQHDPYRPPPAGYPYPAPHQPAPRQRTAIACRYCRRRKIRCSGFDQSEDGRCANCQRFSQECIFTPVSAQAQAFVPAHAVYGRGNPPPSQLYGAYGQPLPPPQPGQHDPYAASRPPAYTLPSPTGHYPPPQSHPGPYGSGPVSAPPMGYPPAPHEQGNNMNGNRKRTNGEPHTPTLPPPNPAYGADVRYPDPAMAGAPVSPASTTSHQSAQQPYYAPPGQQPRRSPPQNGSPYTQDGRASASPRSHHASAYPPYPGEPNLRPPTNRSEGRTPPPPTSTPSQNGHHATAQGGSGGPRPGMSISSIVSTGEGSSPGNRSQGDRDMLQRLGK